MCRFPDDWFIVDHPANRCPRRTGAPYYAGIRTYMAVSRNTPGVENQHVRVGPSVRTNAHYGRPDGTDAV